VHLCHVWHFREGLQLLPTTHIAHGLDRSMEAEYSKGAEVDCSCTLGASMCRPRLCHDHLVVLATQVKHLKVPRSLAGEHRCFSPSSLHRDTYRLISCWRPLSSASESLCLRAAVTNNDLRASAAARTFLATSKDACSRSRQGCSVYFFGRTTHWPGQQEQLLHRFPHGCLL
jgi:hypothetical protein